MIHATAIGIDDEPFLRASHYGAFFESHRGITPPHEAPPNPSFAADAPYAAPAELQVSPLRST